MKRITLPIALFAASTLTIRDAGSRQRTSSAARVMREANHRDEFHERLIEIPAIPAIVRGQTAGLMDQ